MSNKRLLTICNYITDDGYTQFKKNRTGYGYVVGDIVKGLAKEFDERVYCYSGNYKSFEYEGCQAIDNRMTSLLKATRIEDIFAASWFVFKHFRFKKESLRVAFSYLARGKLSSLMKKSDAIHVHGSTPNLIPLIALSLKLEKRTIVTLHGLNSFSEYTKASTFIRKAEKKLLKMVTENKHLSITVLTPAAKEVLVEHIGEGFSQRVSVIPNFLNSHFFDSGDKSCKSGIKSVVYVGNLSEQKNQKSLLNTIIQNKRYYLGKVKFIFIGEICGDFSSGIAFSNNYPELVEFTGHISREKVIEYYAQSELTVLLSKAEGFGMSIIEGFCFGNPCLINSKMEIASLFDNEKFVIKVDDINDTKEVHHRLQEALNDEFSSDEIKLSARSYSAESILAKYERAINY